MSPLFRRGGEKPPPKPPKESSWDAAETLIPIASSELPPLVSDGAGLPFAPELVSERGAPLSSDDPPVKALLEQLKRSSRRYGDRLDEETALLSGWRQLAREENEVLYAGGQPPELLTVVVRRDSRRGRWSMVTMARGATLRAARERIRASSFRLDPIHEPSPRDTTLHLLVTEQTHSSGRLAHGRMLPPDLHLSDDAIVLRLFIRPIEGFQNKTVKNHETPVLVELPEPLGEREVRDGAVFLEGIPRTRR